MQEYYALIIVNILKYVCIYLNKQFWICQKSQCVCHCINYWDRSIFITLSNISDGIFCKIFVIFLVARLQPEIFLGRGSFMELGDFSSIVQGKKTTLGNIRDIFLLDTLKTTSWVEYLISRFNSIRVFFPKIRKLFRFSKSVGKTSPPPPWLLTPSVTEHALLSLNILKYPWECLKMLENILSRPGLWIFVII